MVEAAGSVDESNMTRLEGSDEAQRMSAKVMHGSLFPRLMICFISFIIGSMATYQQITFEYFVFTVLNGILGFVIFFFHCTSNETVSFWIFKTCFNMQNCNFSQVRAKLSACFGKICGKKKSETDTEALKLDNTEISEIKEEDQENYDK